MATVADDADVGDRGPVPGVPSTKVLVTSDDDNGRAVPNDGGGGSDGGGVLTPMFDAW